MVHFAKIRVKSESHLDKLLKLRGEFLLLPHDVGSGFCSFLQLSVLLRQSLVVVQQLAHLGL